jgi:hypothetical protein
MEEARGEEAVDDVIEEGRRDSFLAAATHSWLGLAVAGRGVGRGASGGSR